MKTLAILLASVVLAAPSAHAAVVDSAAGGFTVRHVVEVRGQAASAYRTLVDRVSVWWQADHTFSGNAANLSIDARPGGCFCKCFPAAEACDTSRSCTRIPASSCG